MSIRVLIVDDQALLRTGFRLILAAQADLHVVGEAGDGRQAVDLAVRLQPDVILMDVRMPVMDGVQATRELTAVRCPARVLILTTFDLDEYAFSALQAGASGFLLKDVPPEQLLAAIRTLAGGEAVISPRITRELLTRYAHHLPVPGGATGAAAPGLDLLTDREHEVLLHLAAGLSNQEIAAALFVSEATVKSHVTKVLAKLALRDRVQAVVYAYQHALVTPGTDPPA